MRHRTLTIITPIKTGKVDELRELLAELGKINKNRYRITYSRLERTHFLRWAILDRDPRYKPVLAFASIFDGSEDEHLQELRGVMGGKLDDIYRHCDGYPASGTGTWDELEAYLKKASHSNAVFYEAYPLTVAQIRKNTRDREAIQTFLDGRPAPGTTPFHGPTRLRDDIRASLELSDAMSKPPVLRPALRAAVRTVAMVGILLALLVVLIVSSPLVLMYELRDREEGEKEKKQAGQAPQAAVRKPFLGGEDHQVQNPLTHVVTLKKGWFRLLMLKVVLPLVNLMARHVATTGSLAGITSIHFAHWLLIDSEYSGDAKDTGNAKGAKRPTSAKRLLFFSNYDGSLESYLDDFITKAHHWLTLIWTNTEGFPDTHFLVFGGATKEEEFKKWTCDHEARRQHVTQVWYSAHVNESVQNILSNAAIQDGLHTSLSGKALQHWLRRL